MTNWIDSARHRSSDLHMKMLARPARPWWLAAGLASTMAVLAGCVQEMALASGPPAELLALCEEHSGTKIYETVDGVDGFLFAFENGCSSLCRASLLDGYFSFVESSVDSGRRMVIAPGPGVYRFTLARRGDPRCGPFEEWHTEAYPQTSAQGRHIDDFKGTCIATERIEALTVPYEMQWPPVIVRERWYGRLNTNSKRIVDRRDGHVLAESRRHWVDPPRRTGRTYCPDKGARWSIKSVLIPKRSE